MERTSLSLLASLTSIRFWTLATSATMIHLRIVTCTVATTVVSRTSSLTALTDSG
jgi:hypothetical protein